MNSLNRLALAACTTAALVACGGGGGGTATPTPDPLVNPAAVMQGFWSGSVATGPSGATRASAVVMPDGTAWIALESTTAATGLVKLALTGTATSSTAATLSGSGKYFASGAGTQQAASASATATTAGTLNGSLTVTGDPGSPSAFSWTAGSGYKTAASAADLVATWTGRLGDAALNVTWTFNASGTLSGSSTTGCTYSGTLKPSAGSIAVFDLASTENCAGTTRTLAGIATLSASKSSLNVAYTTDAGNNGGLLGLTKAP